MLYVSQMGKSRTEELSPVLKVVLPGSRMMTSHCWSEPGLPLEVAQLLGPEVLLVHAVSPSSTFSGKHTNNCYKLPWEPSEARAACVLRSFWGSQEESAGCPCPQRQ